MVGLGIIAPLMPLYASDLGATGIWLGAIFSGFSLSRLIFMPIVGKRSDRKGRKRYIVTGLFSYSIISLLYITANSVYYLVILRFIHGFFSAMIIPIAMAYVGETTEDGREGTAMGTFNIALFLGMAFGPFLGGLLNDTLGINSVFYAMSGLTTIAFLVSIIFLPDVRNGESKESHSQLSFKSIMRSDIMKGLILFRITGAMGRGGLMAFLPIIAANINLSSSQVGILISANVFLTAILQRTFGRLADRYNKFVLIIIGSSIGGIALGLVPLAQNFTVMFLLGSVIGIGGAIGMPAATAINVKVGKNAGMGATMGLFNTAMSIGMIAAPMISGIVMDIFGLQSVFYVSGSLILLGTAVFCYFIRRGIKSQNDIYLN